MAGSERACAAKHAVAAEVMSGTASRHTCLDAGTDWVLLGRMRLRPSTGQQIRAIGPFGAVSEFHDYLVAPVKQCPRPELYLKYRREFSDGFAVHFAHADFSYDNVLVDENTGDITGIIDWEMAGFWPEWWEYRKALFGGRCQRWWLDIVDAVMPSYPKEFDVDSEVEMF
jgi:Phosphotransferase enzyme family